MLTNHFEYGTEVRVIRTIRMDQHTDSLRKGECLVKRGSTGFVRHAGYFQQDQLIYSVHFLDSGQVVGCRDSELVLASEPWFTHLFDYGDKPILNTTIAMNGRVIAQKGESVSVIAVYNESQPIQYRIHANEDDVVVPEAALSQHHLEDAR